MMVPCDNKLLSSFGKRAVHACVVWQLYLLKWHLVIAKLPEHYILFIVTCRQAMCKIRVDPATSLEGVGLHSVGNTK